MKLFSLSKYYSLNILCYFSLFANVVYIFYAIYLFKIRTCNGLLCMLDPFIYSLFYYFICITITILLVIALLIEVFLRKSKKDNEFSVSKYKVLKNIMFVLGFFSFILLYLMFFYILNFLINVSANID